MRKLLILVSAAALVVAFTLPAAAETSFYGNVRMWTGWESFDPDVAGQDSVDNTSWMLDTGSSRVGAKFKHDSVGANVELRPNNGSYYRHWYGTWNWGGGTLVVGQTWAPTFACVGSQICEGGSTGSYGDNWGSLRSPQIAIWLGSLKLAALTPNQVAYGGGTASGMLPKIEGQYALKAGPAALTIYGGFNSSEEEVGNTSYDYTSYLFGATAKIGFGAGTLGVNLFTSKNPKEYGHVGSKAQTAQIAGTDIDEVDSMGFMVDFSYKLSPMMKIYVGFGQAMHELDVAGTDEITNTMIYVGLPITLAKGVTLTPEIGSITDEHDTGAATTPAPSTTYYGAYWFIAF
jgi:hypothetical protein